MRLQETSIIIQQFRHEREGREYSGVMYVDIKSVSRIVLNHESRRGGYRGLVQFQRKVSNEMFTE